MPSLPQVLPSRRVTSLKSGGQTILDGQQIILRGNFTMAANWQCLIGWHDIQWQWDGNDAHPCSQIGCCSRCGTEKKRIKHTRSANSEYQDAHSCVMVYPCEKCGDRSSNIIDRASATHRWGEWDWSNSKKCTQVRICHRCHTQSSRTMHKWGGWQFDPSSAKPVRVCEVCGNLEYQEDQTAS